MHAFAARLLIGRVRGHAPVKGLSTVCGFQSQSAVRLASLWESLVRTWWMRCGRMKEYGGPNAGLILWNVAYCLAAIFEPYVGIWRETDLPAFW